MTESAGSAPESGGRRLFLVDASPYVFRAYFSLPDSIRDREGRPANAVYGFASFLIRLLTDERPTHLAIAFDGSLTTSFRNDFFPAYKAQRTLPPAELEAQLDDCQAVAAAFGAACLIDDRYEADDLIATLVARLVEAGGAADDEDGGGDLRAVIVTHDKDLAQLVGPRVTLYDFGKGERLGPAEVTAKLGARPEQVADLLALRGDAVDNIPGVPGVGGKTASALLARFRDLDDLYARLDEVPSVPIRGAAALAARLAEHREAAFLAKRLAAVVRDVPQCAGVTLDDLAWTGADRRRVEEVFDRLGFGTLRGRVPYGE
ncbi:MAG TPA: 5'-3' exonuclease H3TH domain-containing protein [Thermoanaerobaculia bacterium]|nr:5'-3' exonuclease H3TH domain-containing protein [Thermoanaerobaculia bacterium]